MIQAIGGRDLWTTHPTLELEYRVWLVNPHAQRATEIAWRDLTTPTQHILVRGDSVTRVTALTSSGAWRSRNGVVQRVSEPQVRQMHMFWYRDFYTLLRRFAESDRDLYISSAEDRRFIVHSDKHGELGWFEIASDGAPVRWGTLDEGQPLVYVYGPMRQFGAIRFPAWGANLDGTWRFEYARISLHREPIAPALLAPPNGG
jgi:hypothetical protein